MPIVVVEVMPKAELLDPQGKAVASALQRLGYDHVSGVRVGKRFEIEWDGAVDDSVLTAISTVAEEFLANTVIEDVISVHFAGADGFGPSAEDDFHTGNITEDTDVIVEDGDR